MSLHGSIIRSFVLSLAPLWPVTQLSSATSKRCADVDESILDVCGPLSPVTDIKDQIYLLTEIIKSNNPTPALLLNVITHNGMQPNWNDIPLPSGQYNGNLLSFKSSQWHKWPNLPLRTEHD